MYTPSEGINLEEIVKIPGIREIEPWKWKFRSAWKAQAIVKNLCTEANKLETSKQSNENVVVLTVNFSRNNWRGGAGTGEYAQVEWGAGVYSRSNVDWNLNLGIDRKLYYWKLFPKGADQVCEFKIPKSVQALQGGAVGRTPWNYPGRRPDFPICDSRSGTIV